MKFLQKKKILYFFFFSSILTFWEIPFLINIVGIVVVVIIVFVQIVIFIHEILIIVIIIVIVKIKILIVIKSLILVQIKSEIAIFDIHSILFNIIKHMFSFIKIKNKLTDTNYKLKKIP